MLLRDHLNTLIEIQSECVSTLTSLCSCFTSKCMILEELLKKKRDSRGLIIKNYLNLNFNKRTTHLGSCVRSEKPVRRLRRLKSNCSSFDVLADYPITWSQLWSWCRPGWAPIDPVFVVPSSFLSYSPPPSSSLLLQNSTAREEPEFLSFPIPPVETIFCPPTLSFGFGSP